MTQGSQEPETVRAAVTAEVSNDYDRHGAMASSPGGGNLRETVNENRRRAPESSMTARPSMAPSRRESNPSGRDERRNGGESRQGSGRGCRKATSKPTWRFANRATGHETTEGDDGFRPSGTWRDHRRCPTVTGPARVPVPRGPDGNRGNTRELGITGRESNGHYGQGPPPSGEVLYSFFPPSKR